jgi:multisubunit Na+/H+ antiporter MnhB subunit
MEGALIDVETAFDIGLALTLVGFAAVLLTTEDLLDAIVLFILFSLLMALTWGRLGAVDIALAEAAIGAGLTGAMFLNVRGDLEGRPETSRARPRRPARALLAASVVAAMAVVFGAVWAAPLEQVGMREHAFAELRASGVENPVTAVLLSYRALDTLLELTVLLVAVLGTWAQRVPERALDTPRVGPVLREAVSLLVPLSVLIAGYLLWRGSHAPGGAFQAGAVLAGAGVLLLLVEHPLPLHSRPWLLRIGLCAGVLFFVVIGVLAMLEGEAFLFHREHVAARRIVAMEAVATISIAVALIALFAGRAPASDRKEPA